MLLETENIPVAEPNATDKSDKSYTTYQLMKLAEMLEQKGTTFQQFEKVFSSGLLADIFDSEADLGNRRAVRAALKLGPLPHGTSGIAPESSSTIEIDFGLTLDQMIQAGKFEWMNNEINFHQFPVQGEGKVVFEARLFHFQGPISSRDAEQAIKESDAERPWQVARLEHLLAYGAKFPTEQRNHPILALGSVGDAAYFGKRNVPYLYRRVTGRSLHLDWWCNDWPPLYRFLAVRELR
jgi:hypothetical protein